MDKAIHEKKLRREKKQFQKNVQKTITGAKGARAAKFSNSRIEYVEGEAKLIPFVRRNQKGKGK